jgi:eukaryotic translation initiation factor 2C
MVTERILDWYKANNNTFPKNVLYYRDGVSNSQYPAVTKFELPAIGAAFNEAAHKVNILPTPRLNLTAIIVAKRHHVRFFPLEGAGDNNGNCKPGTIIDSMVTDPCYTDFYLQSHRGLKGTAKPAHYFVLRNEIGLSEVQIQDFVSERTD